jgi:hypothetical protein
LDLTTQTYTTRGTPPPLNITDPVAGFGSPAPALVSAPSYRKDPSTYQWNLSLERQVAKDTELTVTYVASLGRNLETITGGNASACCWYDIPQPIGVVLAPGQTQKQPYPEFASVDMYEYRDTSDYQSLQVKVTRRLSHGLTLLAWFAHSRSLGVSYGVSDPRYPTKSALFNDVPNTVTISPIYLLPFGKGQAFLNHGGLLNQIVGGWQISGIFTGRSGFPFTPTLSGSNLLNYSHIQEDFPNRTCSGQVSNPNPNEWFNKACFSMPVEPTTPGALLTEGDSSAYILRGPTGWNLDTGLSKTFSIRERYGLDFRFETFNALNHPNLGVPNASIVPNGNSSLADITTTVTLPRVLQFAMKFHF